MTRKYRPYAIPRWELYENKMVRNCSRLYPGEHPSDVIAYLRLGERMTLQEVAAHLGVGLRTVVDWQPPESWGLMIVSQDERERRRQWMMYVNRINKERNAKRSREVARKYKAV